MSKHKAFFYSTWKTKDGMLKQYPVFMEEQLAHEKRLKEIKNRPSKIFQTINLPKNVIKSNNKAKKYSAKVAVGNGLLKGFSKKKNKALRNQYRIKYYSILAGNDSDKLKKELTALENLIASLNLV
jgi:hypothetical protein